MPRKCQLFGQPPDRRPSSMRREAKVARYNPRLGHTDEVPSKHQIATVKTQATL